MRLVAEPTGGDDPQVEQLFLVFLELCLADDKTSFLLRLPRAEMLVGGVSCAEVRGRFSQSVVSVDSGSLLDF